MAYCTIGRNGSACYVFQHTDGTLRCCMCTFILDREGRLADHVERTFAGIVAHLETHISADDHVPEKAMLALRVEAERERLRNTTPPDLFWMASVKEKMRGSE